MLEDFQIVSGDEGEGTAADLMQMRQRGASAKPEFEGGFSVENSGRCQGRQVCSCGTEFIPQIGGGIASQSHCTGLAKNGSM